MDQLDCWWSAFMQFLGELWIQNVILAITAILGLWTFKQTSKHEKQRATVETVRELLRDPEIESARRTIRTLEGVDVAAILSEVPPATRRLAILNLLNSYEFMAAGIRQGSFDGKTYRRVFYSNVLHHWEMFRPFIIEYREKKGQTVYQDFQWLAEEWKKHPLKRSL